MFTSSEFPKFALSSTIQTHKKRRSLHPKPFNTAQSSFSKRRGPFQSFPRSTNLRFSSLQQGNPAIDLKEKDLEKNLNKLAALRMCLESAGANGRVLPWFSNCNYKLVLSIYVVSRTRINFQMEPHMRRRPTTCRFSRMKLRGLRTTGKAECTTHAARCQVAQNTNHKHGRSSGPPL